MMKTSRSPEVDAYIARAPEFARPILEKVRGAFQAGCPEIEERIKWGVPSFEHKGMLGGMAAFKKHVTFGFWKSRLMEDFDKIFTGKRRASMMGARVESLADLPPKKTLVAYVREAKREETGKKRLVTAIEWLAQGKRRNWKYERGS